VVCPVAGELVSELNVAIAANMKLSDLASVMHPYPSFAFAIQQMAADVAYQKLKARSWSLSVLRRVGF
jgi:hypothetical protein